MRTWYPVSAIKYYNPVLSLLAPHSEDNSGGDGSGWVAMRTVRAVREGKGLPIPSSADSEYRVPPPPLLYFILFGIHFPPTSISPSSARPAFSIHCISQRPFKQRCPMPPSQNSFQSGRDLLWKPGERSLPSVVFVACSSPYSPPIPGCTRTARTAFDGHSATNQDNQERKRTSQQTNEASKECSPQKAEGRGGAETVGQGAGSEKEDVST